jgi:hypothetical protein
MYYQTASKNITIVETLGIDGKTYGKLDEKYLEVVYPEIKDTYDKLLEKHYRKFASTIPA